MTFPVVAPDGTVVAMLVALQVVTVAVVPLNLTVLDPCVEPKFEPVIVTEALIAPDVGERELIAGLAACAVPTEKKKDRINTKQTKSDFTCRRPKNANPLLMARPRAAK
jgi:hypothetical protein